MKLRWYQLEAVTKIFAYLNERLGNAIICAATGSGKSLIIAAIIQQAFQMFSELRVMVVSHSKEILQQDCEKIMTLMPNAPVGIYSASLRKRQFFHPIIVGGIQSVYDKAHLFGKRNLLIIDECHMVMGVDMGRYGRFIADLKAINPSMRIVGLTATDYRASTGLLTDGENKIFDDVVYEITIPTLIDEGYLTVPIGKHLLTQADMTGVKMLGDDFNQKQMAEKFSKLEFIEAVIKEDLPYFEGRNSIALFCPSIEIADHVAACMSAHGVPCEAMHGDMVDDELNNKDDIRTDKLERFRSGGLRALASVGMMTVGTDIPNIDCLVLLFATQSPGLLAQVIGRGFRVVYAKGYPLDTKEQRKAAIAAGPKPNFLCLCHGGNLERHGGIADIKKPDTKKKEKRNAVPRSKIRICEVCRTANTLEALSCITCGTELKIERDPTASLSLQASDADIMGTPFSRGEVAEWFAVDDVKYSRHVKEDKSESLRVTYYSGIMQFHEWKKLKFAKAWWDARTMLPLPYTVANALKVVGELKKPMSINVRKKGKFYEIHGYKFNEAIQQGAVNIAS